MKKLIVIILTLSFPDSRSQCTPMASYNTPTYTFSANSSTNFTTQVVWPDVLFLCGPNTVVYDTTHTSSTSCNNVYINAGCTFITSNGVCSMVSNYYVKSGGTIQIQPNTYTVGSYICFEPGATIIDFSSGMTQYTCTAIPPPTYTCSVTSVAENHFRSLALIWPNPVRDVLNIDINNSNECDIKIYNSLGQEVKVINGLSEKSKIDLSEFSNGLYNVVIISNDSYETKKILISRD